MGCKSVRFNYEKISTVTDVNGNNAFKIDAHEHGIEDDSVAVPPFDHDC